MWKTTTVGNTLLMLQNGVNCKQDKSGEGYKITRIETIASAKINYEKTGFAMLDKAQLSKARLEVGDILFSHINSSIHVGKTAIYNGEEPLWHGINLLRLRTVNEVNSNYFNYFLISLFWSGYWKKTSKQSINQASVNQTDIKSIPISYPPLPEQQRIVAKLDSVFIEIDAAIAATEKKQKEVTKLKQAILTNTLHPQTPSAKMWETVKLGDVYSIGSSKRVLKSEWRNIGIPFYRGREITSLSKKGFVDNDLYISIEHYEGLIKKYGVPIENDILITAIGTIGSSYIVQRNDKFYFKDGSVLWLQKKTDILSEYVNYWIRSQLFKSQLDKGNGTTVDTLTISKLTNLSLPLPPLPEQQRIVAKLDSTFTEIDTAIAATEKKIKNYKALKSAILTQELQQGET